MSRLSRDSRTTFVRMSHDFSANVAYFHFNSYDSRAIFVQDECRLVIFSRQIVTRFSHVFSRLSRDCRATFTRHSYECCKNFAL